LLAPQNGWHCRPKDLPCPPRSATTTLVESVAAALQYISYYHPADYITHLARAYERVRLRRRPRTRSRRSSPTADVRRGAPPDLPGHRHRQRVPEDRHGLRFEGFAGSIEDAVNEGVRKGYLNPDNKLRASVLDDPLFARKNTKDNTPAVVHMELVPGNTST
jgi:fumarate hydratase class I